MMLVSLMRMSPPALRVCRKYEGLRFSEIATHDAHEGHSGHEERGIRPMRVRHPGMRC
jgi:hypothetical protein